MNGRVLALGAALVLMTAVSAQAQDEEEEEEFYYAKESSAYAEFYAAGGYFKINGSDGGDDGSGGGGLTVGGHITENFAMEANYEFQSYSKTSLASYNWKYIFMPEDRLQPYLKAGIGVMGGRPNHAFLFMGRFDAGVTFFLSETLGLRGGVGYAVAKHSNHLLLANAGIIYFFE
jgi:opacity protein-like surface antigen